MTADDESNSIVTIVPTSKLLNVLEVIFLSNRLLYLLQLTVWIRISC